MQLKKCLENKGISRTKNKLLLFLSFVFFFSGFTGFVTSTWCAKSSSGNEYKDVKLKTDVCHYTTIRITRKQNLLIKEFDLKNLQAENVPAKFCNIATTTNGTLFLIHSREAK